MYGDTKMSALSALTYEECPHFMPVQEGTSVKCVRVVDGDTLWAAWTTPEGPRRVCVRLRGIDTPELRSHDPAERAAASRARDLLCEMVENRVVTLTKIGLEKYGRVLADVQVEGQSVSHLLLQHPELCRTYSGGVKRPFCAETD